MLERCTAGVAPGWNSGSQCGVPATHFVEAFGLTGWLCDYHARVVRRMLEDLT